MKILPCPFCGSDGVIEKVEAVLGVRKSVGCNTEECMGYQSNVTFSTEREAVKAWNKRSNPPKEKE